MCVCVFIIHNLELYTLRKKGTKLYLLRYKWPSLGWYPEGYNFVPLVRGTTLYLLALYHLRGNFVPQGTFVRTAMKAKSVPY